MTLLEQVRDDPTVRAHGLVIEDVLGEGGSSVVFRARDTRHMRDVAIKVVRHDPSLEHAAERFAREVRVAAGLRHAHILPLYDSGALADGRVFAVMPLAQGRPLRAMIDEGPLAVPDAVRLAREIAEALAYLHERGYCHRDVKPENVLVESGHASLTDFGLATPLDGSTISTSARTAEWWTRSLHDARLTDVGSAVGTPAYMSPEALLGYEEVDERTDVYAVGLVLYEMLAGELPASGRSATELLAQRSRGPAPPLRLLRPDVPQALDAIVQRCTAPEPAARFRRAADLVQALAVVNAGPSGLAAIVPAREYLRAWLPVALLLAGLGIGAMAWHRARRDQELDPQRIVVADLANDTGDSSLTRVGTLAGDVITAALTEGTRLTVVNAAIALPSRQQRSLPVADSVLTRRTRELVSANRAGIVVTGAYFREGPAIEVVVEVTDARGGRVLGVAGPVRIRADSLDAPLAAVGRRVVEIVRNRHAPPD